MSESIRTQRDQASRLFDAMLDDIVIDVALQSHQEVARSRRKCDVCHTQCVLSPTGLCLQLGFCADTDGDVRSCRQGTAGASLPGFGVRIFPN